MWKINEGTQRRENNWRWIWNGSFHERESTTWFGLLVTIVPILSALIVRTFGIENLLAGADCGGLELLQLVAVAPLPRLKNFLLYLFIFLNFPTWITIYKYSPLFYIIFSLSSFLLILHLFNLENTLFILSALKWDYITKYLPFWSAIFYLIFFIWHQKILLRYFF